MSTRKDRRTPWILPYTFKKHTSKKFRDTLIQIKKCRQKEDWRGVVHLKRLLMKTWWGFKRYKNKLN